MKSLSTKRKASGCFWISIGISIFAVFASGCSSKQAMIIPNLSMDPTLQKGEKVVTNFFAYRIEDPQRGDLAVFIPRNTRDLSWVFRVAAVPGDTLSYKKGVLQRNHETIFSPAPLQTRVYHSPRKSKKELDISFPYTLKENEYFFLSDDPSHNHDSRYWGPIERSEIVGKLTHYCMRFPLIDYTLNCSANTAGMRIGFPVSTSIAAISDLANTIKSPD